MHGDQAIAADYDDPMCARLLGTAADVLRSFGSAFGGRHLARLCLKADAIMRRDKPKDAYDVVWLIDALGPAEAAARISESPLLNGELAGDVIGQLTRLTSDQFRDIDSAGSAMYASFAGTGTGDGERRHAYGTVAALRAELRKRGIDLRD
jgi:hypothetical protein